MSRVPDAFETLKALLIYSCDGGLVIQCRLRSLMRRFRSNQLGNNREGYC
jgi:hypothetical protein